jgi:hypothetical protein
LDGKLISIAPLKRGGAPLLRMIFWKVFRLAIINPDVGLWHGSLAIECHVVFIIAHHFTSSGIRQGICGFFWAKHQAWRVF